MFIDSSYKYRVTKFCDLIKLAKQNSINIFWLTGQTIIMCSDWLRYGSINARVSYFQLLGYFLLMTPTLLLTQKQNLTTLILTLSNPHNENLFRKYEIEKCHIKHLPLCSYSLAHIYSPCTIMVSKQSIQRYCSHPHFCDLAEECCRLVI